jgi:hypothetical protein
MSRPINWKKRYDKLLVRFMKLQQDYLTLKDTSVPTPKPTTPAWRRFVGLK